MLTPLLSSLIKITSFQSNSPGSKSYQIILPFKKKSEVHVQAILAWVLKVQLGLRICLATQVDIQALAESQC